MFELILCSSVTILPDYLYRRYAQGKRFGEELNLFSVWFELRWGITACLVLTLSLITAIFYYHPSTTNVSALFRTVTILSENAGRVSDVYVKNFDQLKAGDPIFRLDDSQQQAAVETAKRRIAEIDAQMVVAQSELDAAKGGTAQAKGSLEQAIEEYDVQYELLSRGSGAASQREVERLQNVVDTRQGGLEAAEANEAAALSKIETLLPAQKASAESSLREAEAALEKTLVVAGTDGIVEQFALQPGDIVNPVLRPAGILVPTGLSDGLLQAGFDQISSQVVKVGMIAEVTCVSRPFKIIPMVVNQVQDYIPAGQFRPTDQLVDLQDRARPGTFMVRLTPLYEDEEMKVPAGSKCIANVYTSNHDKLDNDNLGFVDKFFLHLVDTVGVVHAILLRMQAIFLPLQNLVLTGH